jgi:uncharacterized protein (TIGR03118 family)
MTKKTAISLPLAALTGLLWLAPFAASAQTITQTFTQTNLVSNLTTMNATTVDPTLKNPWGMARSPLGPFFVASDGNGTVNLYNGEGQIVNALPQIIVPNPNGTGGTSRPTGVAFNGFPDFDIDAGNPATASVFLFDTIQGVIAGWNPAVNQTNAVITVDESAASASFDGLTFIDRNGQHLLLAANFHDGTVETFDRNFNRLADFTSSPMAGFAPYNVQTIGNTVVVAFAKQNAAKTGNVNGAGLGFVTVFDVNGNTLVNLAQGTVLNAPWAIALAPADFGPFSFALLIGNRGSGTIDAFNFVTGDFLGTLNDSDNDPIAIPGLWALETGNGVNAGSPFSLFFAAGVGGYRNGLFGTITPNLPQVDVDLNP